MGPSKGISEMWTAALAAMTPIMSGGTTPSKDTQVGTTWIQLQRHAGDDAGQIAIAGAFAVAVDGALHVDGAGFQGGQRVRDPQAAVVVGVDADPAIQFADGGPGDGGDLVRQAAAVGIAQHHKIGAGLFRGLPGGEGVFGVQLVAVETMFGVINDELAVVFEEFDGVGDHGQVFLRRATQDFPDVQHGGLAENGDDRRGSLDQEAHLVILFDGHALFAGGTERGEPGVFEFFPAGFGEKLDVLGIAAGPAAFNVMDPKNVEPFGNPQLVRHGEVDAFALRTVAQGRVIDFDLGFHIIARENGRVLSLKTEGVANVCCWAAQNGCWTKFYRSSGGSYG